MRMRAGHSRTIDIIIRTHHFAVPTYRRDYGWRVTQWQRVWSNDRFARNQLASSTFSGRWIPSQRVIRPV
jgi:hypothetical protein